jgi:branched-chain amino acid aminotransferase
MSTPETLVWLNGRMLPAGEAQVPATSTAVTAGYGVFETLRIVDGRAPLAELHVARLQRTCRELGIPDPAADWASVATELAQRCALPEAVVRITLGAEFALVTCEPLAGSVAQERTTGVELRSVSLARPAADMKTTSRLPLVLAERNAGGEVLLRGPAGEGLETSRANLFAVTRGALYTAPARAVLPGIARALVLELAAAQGVFTLECAPSALELADTGELFLTNAVRGVRPVAALDGRVLAPPGPDSLTRRLQRALDERMGISDELKTLSPATERSQ